MPRRIPDYADAYSSFNIIASFGSLISVVSALLFFYIAYQALAVSNFRASSWINSDR